MLRGRQSPDRRAVIRSPSQRDETQLLVWSCSVSSLHDGAHTAMNVGFALVWSAVLRLAAAQMHIVKCASNSFAGLDGFVGFDTAAVLHPTGNSFLCRT